MRSRCTTLSETNWDSSAKEEGEEESWQCKCPAFSVMFKGVCRRTQGTQEGGRGQAGELFTLGSRWGLHPGTVRVGGHRSDDTKLQEAEWRIGVTQGPDSGR